MLERGLSSRGKGREHVREGVQQRDRVREGEGERVVGARVRCVSGSCKKAKYCGKECKSTGWSEGHRFWCSARNQRRTVIITIATATLVRARGLEETRRRLRGQQEAQGKEGREGW